MSKEPGRNEPCPCGSGKKYKRCHGSLAAKAAEPPPLDIKTLLERHRANEKIREAQQGLGKPIVAFKAGNHQFVAVKDKLYVSDKWKTFPDFLAEYIIRKLDPHWCEEERAKPPEERHPLIQWQEAFVRYQTGVLKEPGVPVAAPMTGVVAAYLGLAYSLYLLDHNVELQARLIARLKNVGNFQGAFYELFVANLLIRGGFTLTLEDETAPESKHCEFAAVSPSGKRYWVEAKMRSVIGLLGKNDKDGGPDDKATSQLIPHLNRALAKPAADDRIVFIDLNADPALGAEGKPAWHDQVVDRLERYEKKELKEGLSAYLFVTNMGFHRKLDGAPTHAVVPFGLGINDFNKPGFYRLSDIYRMRKKHKDTDAIASAVQSYCSLPSTFDGSLPSEAFGGGTSRVKIGETYFFENAGEGGIVGTVTSAVVDEQGKQAILAIQSRNGHAVLIKEPMSDAQLEDYRKHKDVYFGAGRPVSPRITDSYGLFEFLMRSNQGMPRAVLLRRLAVVPEFEQIKDLPDDELLAEYCERMTATFEAHGFKTHGLQQQAPETANSEKL